MKFEEFTEENRLHEKAFTDFLSAAGWHAYANTELIRSGFTVTPEGRCSLTTDCAHLSLEIFLQEKVLMLTITSLNEDTSIGIGMQYDDFLSDILQWIYNCQSSINRESFAMLFKEILPKCNEAIFIAEDGKHYKLERAGYNGSMTRKSEPRTGSDE